MKISTKQLCLSAILLALTFVVTCFLQIPIPLGYFNVGNSIILLSCILLPSPCGLIIGSFGSALADLVSYPVYVIPTLIIKFLMPLVFYKISGLHVKKINVHIIAAAISTLIPLFGYTLAGCIIYGNFYTGLAQFPGLFLEYVANILIFNLLRIPVSKFRNLTQD